MSEISISKDDLSSPLGILIFCEAYSLPVLLSRAVKNISDSVEATCRERKIECLKAARKNCFDYAKQSERENFNLPMDLHKVFCEARSIPRRERGALVDIIRGDALGAGLWLDIALEDLEEDE